MKRIELISVFIELKLTNARMRFITIPLTLLGVVSFVKLSLMKNEPVVSYNHMQDDESISIKRERISYSLYVFLIVDAILISAISVFVAKIIF